MVKKNIVFLSIEVTLLILKHSASLNIQPLCVAVCKQGLPLGLIDNHAMLYRSPTPLPRATQPLAARATGYVQLPVSGRTIMQGIEWNVNSTR
jgi:hypothetical protein